MKFLSPLSSGKCPGAPAPYRTELNTVLAQSGWLPSREEGSHQGHPDGTSSTSAYILGPAVAA